MKVGIIISVGCSVTWAMWMGFIIVRVLPWETVELEPPCLFVAPAWFESRRAAKKQKSIAFASYISPVRGAFIKRRQPHKGGESVFILLLWAVRLEGEESLVPSGRSSLFREREAQFFFLQMQFNELWMLLGDWAAVNVGAVRNLHPGFSMFGSNVSVLIQRFWHKLIPLSAAKAGTESLHYRIEQPMAWKFLRILISFSSVICILLVLL